LYLNVSYTPLPSYNLWFYSFSYFLSISGTRLCFNVGEKEAFEVSLADVSQAQMQGKTDVVLEFHIDDTTAANEACFASSIFFLFLLFASLFSRCKGRSLFMFISFDEGFRS
jgi:hypothetical protein